jgi:hypothetical protein
MKNGLLGLWSILAISLVIFLVASSFDEINIGSVTLKSSDMLSCISGQHSEAETAVAGNAVSGRLSCEANEVSSPAVAAKPVPTDTASKTILFIGDSMLEGLSPRLAAYAEANGHKLYTVIWYSSTSKIWGDAHKLSAYIKQFKPDYIFVCLGANELFVKDIVNKRDKCVKSIISEIGSIPYVWIGPPNWKDDTGINQLIARNAAEGCYFKSAGMTFERAKDGAHPTRKSAASWMDSVARWMPRHSSHPIKMSRPAKQAGRANRVVVLQPQV